MPKSTIKKSSISSASKGKAASGSTLSQKSRSASQVLQNGRKSSSNKNGKTFYTADRETDPDLIKANRYLDRAVKAIRANRDY